MSDTPSPDARGESSTRVVSVEIQGLRYPIRSDLDEQYIVRLAAYVDAKMQRATNEVPTGESMKIAVLAALNIADELFRVRDGAPEVALPLALIWAIAMILARRRDARTLDLPSRA